MSEHFVPTVLLVDDDPWILDVAARLLAAESCRVVTTTQGLQAPPMIEWEGVDVIVSDISMPDVDGVALLQRVRELFPDVVRVLLSGTAELETALKAINEAEVFRLLTKPIDEKELRETIRLALDRREALRATRAQEHAVARHAAAMNDLEERHPGLGTMTLEDDRYVIAEERLVELARQFRGSVLEDWLEWAPADAASRAAPPERSAAREFAEELAALRAEYREGLSDRLGELEEAAARAREAPADPTPARHLKNLAHTLRGTAGTLGLQAISEEAGRIEDAARRHLEGRTNGLEAFDEVDEALRAARRSAEAGGS